MVDLPDATATDNSGHVTITKSHKSPLKVTVGSPVVVAYTATDAAKNTRQCTVNVEAKGRYTVYPLGSYLKLISIKREKE